VTSTYAERFERDMGCTEAAWRAALPGAVKDHELTIGESAARVVLNGEGGCLDIAWQPLPSRTIALLSIPRLHVRFAFSRVDEAQRERFMRYFDLYMQRGGG
jgi:hypothetical protein